MKGEVGREVEQGSTELVITPNLHTKPREGGIS
jgi:hypothetical protein